MSDKEEKCCSQVETKVDGDIALIRKDIHYMTEAINGLTAKLSNGMTERLTRAEEKVGNNTKLIWAGLIPIALLVVKASVDYFGK